MAQARLPGNDWGSELADYTAAAQEFFGLARERSIPGQMAGIRKTPLGVRLVTQVGDATAHWVGELKPKPVSAASFAGDTFGALKIASTVVVSRELVEAPGSGAEGYLREALVRALVLTLNSSFADPANAGTADVEPASIANGAPSVASTGDFAADLAALLDVFEGDLSTSYWLVSGATASGLSGPTQPNLTTRGGELAGIPVISSSGVPPGTAVLADAAQIAYGESELMISISTQGTVEMSDTPTGTATYGLWQNNCLGIRVEQFLNWARQGDATVAVMTGL